MIENKKDSFILYTEQIELFDELNDEQAGKLIKGIFNYVKTGEEPAFEDKNKLAFIPIRQMLDRNAEKYEEKREKLSQNGKKGGRPPLNSSDSKISKTEHRAKEEISSNKNNFLSVFKKEKLPIFRNKKEDDCVNFTDIVKKVTPEFYRKMLEHQKSKDINTE